MRRRRRPMVPQPTRTPMPEKEKDPEKKARPFSLYMRPWTLHQEWATSSVPHICQLDCSQETASAIPKVKPGGLQHGHEESARSYERSWRHYIRGNVVSRHAQRLIVQFMAANCGKSTTRENPSADDEHDMSKKLLVPDNSVPLSRVHAIIDNMSSEKMPGDTAAGKRKKKKATATEDFPEDFNDDEMDCADPEASTPVKEALVTTGKLWNRQHWSQDAEPNMDVRSTMLSASAMATLSGSAQPADKQQNQGKKRLRRGIPA